MHILGVLIFPLIMVTAFAMLGGMWLKGVAHVVQARRTGAVRTRSIQGGTVYRSLEPDRFRSVLRWRTIGLVVMTLPVAWFAFLAAIALLALVAALLGFGAPTSP
ncbi:MAG: hypothetical protein QM608_19755 [Caulobacter sp.]